MKYLSKLIAATLLLITSTVMAGPMQLITHNETPYESNAFVGQNFNIASPHPTRPYSTNRVFWGVVQVICGKRTGNCTALIKMKTNTTPIELGKVTLNLETGDINPKSIESNGFIMTVIGPGETMIKMAH